MKLARHESRRKPRLAGEMSETNPLRIRLSRIASSKLASASLVNNADEISVGDIREVMRLLANMDGWYRTACELRVKLMSREKFIHELTVDGCEYGDNCPSDARHYMCLACKAEREMRREVNP